MSQVFTYQLGFTIRKSNIGAQKIDGTTLETYGMVVSTFFVSDKDDREWFFEKSFLLADVKVEIILGIPFLTIRNADVNFIARDLQWRSYTIGDILRTIRQVELIGKKEFAVVFLDPEYKAFIIHVATLSVDSGDEVHPSTTAQIAYLKVDEALTKMPSEYANFANVFSPKLATELPKYGISNYVIKLVDDQQPSYSSIYSLGLVKLEILKAYFSYMPV